ncbi:MAG: DUF6525 family protein [Pseudomonadota bacterium]
MRFSQHCMLRESGNLGSCIIHHLPDHRADLMRRRTSRNLGATSIRIKRRNADPMRIYDGLPAPLRQWLSEAALPWSPASARRIWKNASGRGLCVEEALSELTLAEARTLARDRSADPHNMNSHV